MSNTIRDTGRARLPALPPTNAQDPSLRNWMSAVAERLEVREGSRGNPFERAVTVRELEAATAGLVQITAQGQAQGDGAFPIGNGLSASINIERFADSIRNTRLYRDLMKRLDDPTRFDHLASEIRSVLLKSIADEAAARGADIRRNETLIQDANRSLAMAVQEVTAALGDNSAGIRELQAAYVGSSQATAVKVMQLESSLGNYYQDGSAGRVKLEQEMLTQASYVDGLRGQYTLKIQAGGALAGFGLAASEVNGVPSSAFIISADKFAIVSPRYTGGLTTTPNTNDIPFGVDTNGIYLNNNVYIRGKMRVDTGGKTLNDGLRGSLSVAVTGTAWSDTKARQAIWAALGNGGSAANNNHLVIGDQVTISGTRFVETRYWTGSSWATPGAVINGNLLVDGSISAGKIDTRGLTIKDANGNVIFGAGAALSKDFISGLGRLATQNSVSTNQVSGLGTLATKNYAAVGSTVTFPDGTVINTGDFVNRLSKIDGTNISTFMESAAIGNAYIGNAAVSTLKIAGESVSKVRHVNSHWHTTIPELGEVTILDYRIDLPPEANDSKLIVMASTPLYASDNVSMACGMRLYVDNQLISSVGVTFDGSSSMLATFGSATVNSGGHVVSIRLHGIPPWNRKKPGSGVLSLVAHGVFR